MIRFRFGVDFDELAEHIDPATFAHVLGLERPHGRGNYRCPMPGHDDENPSMSVFRNRSRTAARCHGCGKTWTPVGLAGAVWGLPLHTAAERLARDSGLGWLLP